MLGTQSCRKKDTAPRISVGVNADFNMHLESFLNQLSEREQLPVIHALIFLAEEELDPEYYKDKGIVDTRHIPLSDELRYRLNGMSVREILNLTHLKFNRVQAEYAENLEKMRKSLQNNQQRLEEHFDEEEMLYEIKLSDFQYEYEKLVNVIGKLTVKVTNGTKKKISAIQFTIQFKDRKDDQFYPKLQRTWSDPSNPLPILPGESRILRNLVLSNVPVLTDLKADQYASRLEPVFILDNAFDEFGGPFRKIPNSSLMDTIKQQQKDVEYLENILEQSNNRRQFTFWDILSSTPVE